MRVIQEHELAAYLEEIRADRPYSKMAKSLGVHPNTLSNLANGRTGASGIPLKLIRALGLKPAFIAEDSTK